MMIHLAIAFDQNYLSPFHALINSIFHNNKHHQIIVHAIVSGVSDDEKGAIQQYAVAHNASINYYNIDDQTVSRFVVTSKWTSAVYYRLYFPLLVSNEVKRLLYLDTDTLVLNDLEALYTAGLEGCAVGAVYDNWVINAPQLGITGEGNYFNSGVMVIDIQKWKAQKVSERCFEYLQNYPERILFVDQDALNAVLRNNWKKMDIRFNYMYSLIPEDASRKQLKRITEDKVVVHFTLQRPWLMLCKNRLRELYFYYLRTSPAKAKKPIVDFNWNKVPKLIEIRLVEYYNDLPALQRAWRLLKAKAKGE